jgi:amidase
MAQSSKLRTTTMKTALCCFALFLVWSKGTPALAQASTSIAVDEATIAQINTAFDAKSLTAEQLVKMCLARIGAYDKQGPSLRALITVNPEAVEAARKLDLERRTKGRRSALHGIPVVLKDNIDTADMPTTAGSVMLEGSVPSRDAFIVERLRQAGAVILAKANMSEFASGPAISSIGGQMKNPHDLARTPLGSSGGSGIAVAAAYTVIAIGTDTGGSIRNPSFTTGIVGLKPTLGLISRHGIVPLALTFDTAGPLARNVYDVAVALSVLAGVDPADPMTRRAEGHVEADYTKFLKTDALSTARLGIARDFTGQDPDVDWGLEAAIASMRRAGATIVDVRMPKWLLDAKGEFYDAIRYPEFAEEIKDYLSTLGPSYPKNIEQLMARAMEFKALRPDGATPNPARWTMFKRESESGKLDDYRYTSVRDHGLPMVRSIIEGILTVQQLDAIVYPTRPKRAPLITAPADPPGGFPGNPVNLANLTGFPDLVVPAGFTADGLPVTLSFLGQPFSEPRLLAIGYSFEQATHARRLPKHTPRLDGEIIRP